MAHIILFDNEVRDQLLPFTFTRPVCEIRVGILTIKEKWEKWFGGKVAYITQDYLAEKYPIDYGDENYIINGSVLPSEQLCTLLEQMDFNEAFLKGDELIAAKLNENQFEHLIHDEDIGELKGMDLEGTDYMKIDNLWDIFRINEREIQNDFGLLTKGRKSKSISHTNQVLGRENIFLEEGAKVECSILNATTGPIYLGKDSEIMEGSMIRGGLMLGEASVLKMGTKIYGPTTIGPGSKIGGEVKNCVIQGYTNKGHDGYLGNSVIGNWCNLGAATNCSNLKNNYSDVKVWQYGVDQYQPTDQQFCGLFMGDFSRSGINTMFNTGTVVGICASLFGGGFMPKFIPSFSWGGPEGFETYQNDKAFETIEKVMSRKNKSFNIEDRLILLRVFEETSRYRKAPHA